MTYLRTDKIVFWGNLTKIGFDKNKAIYSNQVYSSWNIYEANLKLNQRTIHKLSYSLVFNADLPIELLSQVSTKTLVNLLPTFQCWLTYRTPELTFQCWLTYRTPELTFQCWLTYRTPELTFQCWLTYRTPELTFQCWLTYRTPELTFQCWLTYRTPELTFQCWLTYRTPELTFQCWLTYRTPEPGDLLGRWWTCCRPGFHYWRYQGSCIIRSVFLLSRHH